MGDRKIGMSHFIFLSSIFLSKISDLRFEILLANNLDHRPDGLTVDFQYACLGILSECVYCVT